MSGISLATQLWVSPSTLLRAHNDYAPIITKTLSRVFTSMKNQYPISYQTIT